MSSHVDYQHFRRGERCTEEGCRARKFYIEDGKKFCQRGHEQSGFTQTQQDEDDWNAQGKTSRKKGAKKERVETILRGRDARELYLQCFQLILWKQCHWLITVKGFPKDLEAVVRDLWSMRLGFIHKPWEERSGFSSGTSVMMFSSTSEGDNTDTDGSGFNSLSSRRSRKSDKSVGGDEKPPKLPETLALCYLGTLLMRLPTSLGEILKWVARGEIVYNRAIKEIPKGMRAKLPAYFHSALEAQAPLKGSTIHRAVLDLAEFYNSEFEIVFPPLNTPLLLFKHMKNLGLPVEIYAAVRRLARLLEIDFNYPNLDKRLPGVIAYPEIQLISLIVVATKLSHPFDSTCVPDSEGDPTTVRIDWKSWREIMVDSTSAGIERGEEMGTTEDSVTDMDGKKIDDYLDWYQRTWIDDRDSKMSATILELFPLSEISPIEAIASDSETRDNRLKQVQQNMTLQRPSHPTAGLRRPGEDYRRYKRVEDIPEVAVPFYELAASNTAISVEMLAQAVYKTEGHLMECNLEYRRRIQAEQEDTIFNET